MRTRNTPPELAQIPSPEVDEEQVQTIDTLEDALAYVMPTIKEIWQIVTTVKEASPIQSEITNWHSLYRLGDEKEMPLTISELAKMLYKISLFLAKLNKDRLGDHFPHMEGLKRQLKEHTDIVAATAKESEGKKRIIRIVEEEIKPKI